MATPDPRARSMSALKARILQPSLTSHYEVFMQAPTTVRSYIKDQLGLEVNGNNMEDRVTVPCSEASLPGARLATHELKDDFTGITQKHAHRRLYDDSANFTFYVDAKEYYIIRFIEGWLSYISLENVTKDVFRDDYNHRMAFPSDYYASVLKITKFERDYNTQSGKLVYEFRDAFPIGISAMPMSYDSSQLMKCTVEFQFSRYTINDKNRRIGTILV